MRVSWSFACFQAYVACSAFSALQYSSSLSVIVVASVEYVPVEGFVP